MGFYAIMAGLAMSLLISPSYSQAPPQRSEAALPGLSDFLKGVRALPDGP